MTFHLNGGWKNQLGKFINNYILLVSMIPGACPVNGIIWKIWQVNHKYWTTVNWITSIIIIMKSRPVRATFTQLSCVTHPVQASLNIIFANEIALMKHFQPFNQCLFCTVRPGCGETRPGGRTKTITGCIHN